MRRAQKPRAPNEVECDVCFDPLDSQGRCWREDCPRCDGGMPPQAKHDAQLADAAPDLLKALKRFLSHVHKREVGERTMACPCALCEDARAAIKKAEGDR